ncbi:MAG: tryptophan 7-halogenase [Cyclobacteriaceae bacterium]|nr:tryptophan 7-halogenase [Cyclobacteriaceae bacterium]
MNSKTDVLVIGAGPAGSIAASFVHRAGLQVRVVEREKFPRFVIGESLLPRCMDVLEEAGFLEAITAKHFQQKFGAKFLRGEEIADFNFSESFTHGWTWTWQVPRADFDLTLVEELQRRGILVDFETTVNWIEFQEDERSVTTVLHSNGDIEKIEARFIIDASGYGRVIPRLFKLDRPSNLEPRRAIFAHLQDMHRTDVDEPNRIIIVSYAPQVWVWIIPFSTGITSLGFVGSPEFYQRFSENREKQFSELIAGNAYLKNRFGNASLIFEPRILEAWSTTADKFYGNGFVLTGNVTEFLDPIFSSGVMFATVSSQLASQLVIKKLQGEKVDWEIEYTNVIQQGVDTFRSYVMAWYDGTLEKIFFAKNPNPEIKRKICSVLAGYVWDADNAFVRKHTIALKRLARVVDVEDKLTERP